MGYKIITLFSAMITFWLGLYAYKQSKDAPVVRRFFEFTTVLAVWIFTNFVVALKPSAYLIQITYSTGTVAMSLGLLWVLWLIGRPLSKKIILGVYVFCGLVIAWGLIPGVIVTELISYDFTKQTVNFSVLFYPFAAINIIGILGIIILLIRQYIISKGIKRLRIKYILLGLGFSCVIPLFGAYVLPIFNIFDFTNYDAPCMIIFVVLAAYTMSRHQLMSVSMLKKKVFKTFITIASFIIAVALLSYIFYYMFGLIIGLVFGLLSFAVAITFMPANSIKRFVESNIIHEKYNLVAIMSNFSVQLSNTLDIKELAKVTVEFLVSTIKAPNVILFLYQNDKFIPITSHRFAFVEIKNQPGVYSLIEHEPYIIIDELEYPEKLFKATGINPAILYPLKNKDGVQGFIIVGERKPDYEENDIEVISVVSDAVLLNIGTAMFYQQAMSDALTGLFTRRYFDLIFPREVLNCQKKQIPLALLFIDIDNFKSYNDTYGHQKGDEILTLISNALKSNLRSDDIICRYGGEELVIIIRETRKQLIDFELYCKGVATIGERILTSIRKFNLTISIGICITQKEYVPAKIIKAADSCLYKAKGQGKDRSVSEIL